MKYKYKIGEMVAAKLGVEMPIFPLGTSNKEIRRVFEESCYWSDFKILERKRFLWNKKYLLKVIYGKMGFSCSLESMPIGIWVKEKNLRSMKKDLLGVNNG